MPVAPKRKCQSDDEDEENRGDQKAKQGGANSNAWLKFTTQLKRSKNKDHDNYDASKFVSQFRKPLAIMPANSETSGTSSAASAILNTSVENGSGKSHVNKKAYSAKK